MRRIKNEPRPKPKGTTSDTIIAALEMALRDGMDVVNLSVGGMSSWPEFPEARAAQNLVDAGIIVVAAQGNHASDGPWSVSSPSIAPDVISVAATETDYFLGGTIAVHVPTVIPDLIKLEYSSNIDLARTIFKTRQHKRKASIPSIPGITRFHFVDSEGCVGPEAFPNSIAKDNTTPWVFVIRRGNCTVSEKAAIAASAGASGALVYNNNVQMPTELFRFVMREEESVIPAAGISWNAGQQLKNLLDVHGDTVRAKWADGVKVFDNFEAKGRAAEFSSWGPGPYLEAKPDLAAPGTFILSTFLLKNGSYAIMSGTSMATPIVSGSAAFLLSRRPDLSPSDIRTLLVNTAAGDAKDPVGSPALPVMAGSGILRVSSALISPVIVRPASIAFGYVHTGQEVKSHVVFEWIGGYGMSTQYSIHIEKTGALDLVQDAVATQHSPQQSLSSHLPDDFYQIKVSPSMVLIGDRIKRTKVYCTVSVMGSFNNLKLVGGFIVAKPYDTASRLPLLRIPYQLAVTPTDVSTISGSSVICRAVSCFPDVELIYSNNTVEKIVPTAGLRLSFSLLLPSKRVAVLLKRLNTVIGYIDVGLFLGKNGKNNPKYAVEWQKGHVYLSDEGIWLGNIAGKRWLRRGENVIGRAKQTPETRTIDHGHYRVCLVAEFNIDTSATRDEWCSAEISI
ncbi:hypothetical protein HDU67_000177 [Dinochytrium kinnereticum]|nr:hypothetical protein HDU67_000177 [Dinochytrium kinnereticum]